LADHTYFKNIKEINLFHPELSIQTDILANLYDKLTTTVIRMMHMLEMQRSIKDMLKCYINLVSET